MVSNDQGEISQQGSTSDSSSLEHISFSMSDDDSYSFEQYDAEESSLILNMHHVCFNLTSFKSKDIIIGATCYKLSYIAESHPHKT